MDWSQLQTILWLRWRLTRNQLSRGGSLNAALAIAVIVIVFIVGAAGGIAGLLVGAFAFDTILPNNMLVIWDVITILFLFIWMIGLVSEVQRSETIDIGKLLHLPISLKDVFLINFLASHITLTIIVFVPGMLGFCIGLALGHNWIMIMLLPLVLGFIFMITAWTYCFRGWLVTLMVNPRRRRTVIAIVTFSFVLLSQLPNLLGNFFGHHERHRSITAVSSQTQEPATPATGSVGRTIPQGILVAHKIVPFLWVGNGAMSLTNDSPWAALFGTAGAFGLGCLGIRRAYRTTVRFYQGAVKSGKVRGKIRKVEHVSDTKNRLEESLPFVSDDTSALAMAFFQNLRRATEIKMMLATNFLMMLFVCIMIFFRNSDKMNNIIKPFVVTGVIAFSFMGLIHLMFNQFGYDRNGFRMLVLSPVPRKCILQGKNFAFLPFAMCIGGFLILIVKLFLHITLLTYFSAILQLITAYLLLCIIGNYISITNPYRVSPGSMKPTKMSTLKTIIFIFSGLLFPVAISPILIPPAAGLLLSKITSLPAGIFNLLFSAIILPVIIFFYRLSLAYHGDLLQRREKKILDVVTREVE